MPETPRDDTVLVADATDRPADETTPRTTVLRGGRTWLALAIVSPLVTLATHAYVVWGAKWPSFPYDEVYLLQMSRAIAGKETPDRILGNGYFPGWSVVTAPIWWFTSNPSVAYQATLWVGVAVSLVTIWPLARIVTRFGLSLAPAVVVASIVMTMPARAIEADYAMSERLLTLTVVLMVLAAFRVAERPTLVRHLVLAVAVGAMVFTHVRVLVAVGAVVVWLAMRWVRGPRRETFLGAGAVVVAAALATFAGRVMTWRLIHQPFTQGDSLMGKLADSRPSLFARVGIGQGWYQVVASYGLVLFGLLLVVAIVWRQVRRWDIGAETLVLGCTVAIGLLSLAQWANDYLLFDSPWVRLDAWIYGRYIDPLGTVLTAIGAAVALRGVSRRLSRWSIGTAVGTAILAIVVLTPQVPTWGWVTPAHIPGILAWAPLLPEDPWPRNQWIVPSLTNGNSLWIIAPLCVVVLLVLVTVLRRRPAVIAVVVLALAFAGSVVGDSRSDEFRARETRYVALIKTFDDIAKHDDHAYFGYAPDCDRGSAGNSGAGTNYFGYVLLPKIMRFITASDDPDEPPVQMVLACDQWAYGASIGARQVVTDGSQLGSRIWILPGALQDRLAREGRLVPAAP